MADLPASDASLPSPRHSSTSASGSVLALDPQQVYVKPTLFTQALHRYVDENKPDPMMLQQMQGWEWTWTNDDSTKPLPLNAIIEFHPTRYMAGTLQWKSTFITVFLSSACWWTEDGDEPGKPTSNSQRNSATRLSLKKSNKRSSTSGSLYFSCRAYAEFNHLLHDEGNSKKGVVPSSHVAKRPEQRIQQKMSQRLGQDDYIAKLLSFATKDPKSRTKEQLPKISKKKDVPDPDSALDDHTGELCQAAIRYHPGTGPWEERVWTSPDVAEGLRRSVFSQAESTLEVLDLIFHLPLLPGTIHSFHDEDQIVHNGPTAVTSPSLVSCSGLDAPGPWETTPLADRARLRLLEDAMYDACENEGEEELVQELDLSTKRARISADT